MLVVKDAVGAVMKKRDSLPPSSVGKRRESETNDEAEREDAVVKARAMQKTEVRDKKSSEENLVARIVYTRHEINNLLTGILGQSQLVLMREEVEPAVRERIETIESLAKRIKAVVADLNDV